MFESFHLRVVMTSAHEPLQQIDELGVCQNAAQVEHETKNLHFDMLTRPRFRLSVATQVQV